MTDIVVYPSTLSGTIDVPPSKSHSIRAITLASLAHGESYIENLLPSADIERAIEACKLFGAQIKREGQSVYIQGTSGKFKAPSRAIDSGNSGQVLRFVGAFSALSDQPTEITGDHSIQNKRPVKPLIDALNQLGAEVRSIKNNHRAPIVVKGPVQAGYAKLCGQDSQPVSALLMLGAQLEGETIIEVENPGEKPWIDLTLDWLKRLGVEYENESYEKYRVFGKKIKGFNYKVPGDFSSACFGGAAAMLSGSKVTLNNLDFSDSQGDKKVFEIFQNMGAKLSYLKNKNIVTIEGKEIRGDRIDINSTIDAITILSVLGCFSKLPLELVNASIARQKESDRISSICTELKKMGADIKEKEDGLSIKPSTLKGTTLKTYKDHRMVMSLTLAALHATSPSIILDIDSISKSYPSFLEDMRKLGAKIELL